MIQSEIKRAIFGAIKKAYPEIIPKEIKVERTKDPRFGDYTTNISLKIASSLGQDPFVVSSNIAHEIKSDLFSVEAVSGFINFKLVDDYYQRQLKKILAKGEDYAKSKVLSKKKIQVEFISANPTGPLHIGNARGGFVGDVLANVFKYLGANVEREYYVNDAGNQIATLGESALYAAGVIKKTSDEIYRGEYIDKWVIGKKRELKKNADNPKKIGKELAKHILNNYIKKTIKEMKVKFDNYFSEQSLIRKGTTKKVLEYLKNKDLTYEEEGATWFEATKFGDKNDHVLVRSDGVESYYLNDIAYHYDKLSIRKFDKVVNVLGADHHGHAPRTKAAVAALGHPGKLDIVLYQLVRLVKNGKEYRMSKRKGNVVTIDNLFDLIGGDRKEASDIARFFFLSHDVNAHMDFDLNLSKDRSEKNPVFYVKYAYARICGILRKSKNIDSRRANLSLLNHESEIKLIKELIKLPELLVAIAASKDYPVHHLSYYSRSVAQKFHSFYNDCRIIDKDNIELTKARLKLTEATQIVLKITMEELLGIEAPKRM